MTFYNTYVTYNGDGTTTDFSVPFYYLDLTEVIVTFSGPGTYTYTFPSPSVIRTSPALAVGTSILIERNTGLSSAKVVFTNGAPVTGGQLNTTVNQLLYGLQEASDSVSAAADAAVAAASAASTATSAAAAATAAAASANAAASGTVGDNSITTAKIVNLAVTNAKIADTAVTTGKLADGSVSTVKLADGSVNTLKLADGAVSVVKIAATGTPSANTALLGNGTWGALVGDPVGTQRTMRSLECATTAASGTGSVVTITFNANFAIPVGQNVVIAGMTPAGYNGTWLVTASTAAAGASTVSFASTTTGAQTVAGTLYNAPVGYLREDASYYLRSAYPALAALIGTPFQLSAETQVYSASVPNGNTFIYSANNILFAAGTASAESNTATTVANALITSPDGTTWTSRTAVNPSNLSLGEDAVAYNGSIYVLCADPSNAGLQTLWTSPDLATWTKRSTVGLVNHNPLAIAYGGTGNNFVTLWGVDNCGFSWGTANAYSSTNGTTWTVMTGLTGISLQSVAGYSGAIVAVSTANKVFYSATGSGAFTDISSGISGATGLKNVSYANARFILTTTGGIYTSTTGATGTWSQVSTVVCGNNSKIRWNGTFYVNYNNGQFSLDLITWFSANAATNLGNSYGSGYSAVANNKFYTRDSTGAIKWIDSNTYNTSTQFPVGGSTPVVSSSFRTGANTASTFIKT